MVNPFQTNWAVETRTYNCIFQESWINCTWIFNPCLFINFFNLWALLMKDSEGI